ncbi:acetyl esterase/lipase [Pseudonocardia sediminis]|uniref:Acetyl esterase/lipase n=1 Tax=Pseudonocardia sediminis TaxID=1397368 RepID=A0A4Q7V2R6_PSEST|nr:alpha/beta hydrolase [Pseudonocardia sediminis]RZT88395.1 acetyl esterase/lipase [Pseudonocardia sediminis]
MPLPLAANRLLTSAVVAPLLSPRLPVPVRRRLLDLTGAVLPLPRGTRRATGALGGVPTEVVSAAGPVTSPHRILYLHGGGYVVGSPASHRALLAGLSRAAGTPVHAPIYRLAPEHPHPAAVEDALTAFRALRIAGHPARRIAIAGDSAGGGLAMSVVLRLRENGEDLPGSIGLISPWLDLDCTSPVLSRNASTDAMLDPAWLPDAARDYRGTTDPADLRPLDAELTGLPPLHVVAGAGEVLLDDADRLVEGARAAGVPTTYRRAEGMWHAFPVLAGTLREADDAVTELGASLRTDCLR